jgi:ubiquinone/menaquinone biosynthesis C-methylase UbiE
MLRIENNSVKKNLLSTWVPRGSRVLDVGCGQGGDVHKWNSVGVSELVGIDPNPWAIREARRRSKNYDGFTFAVGDIRCAPRDKPFDVICYNFSLQYQPLELLSEITERLSDKGGLFIGVVTDSTRLEFAKEQGIQVERVDAGRRISVFIPDTPYYANGPVTEPILEKDEFIREAERLGLELQVWEPFSMYAKFVFRCNTK